MTLKASSVQGTECLLLLTSFERRASYSAFYNLKAEYDAITTDDDAEQQKLFPITNDTVGKIITDPDHVRWIHQASDDFVPSENNPYLQAENSVYLKEITEDGFTEVAILDEDSVPILSTSFNHMDGFHPGDEPVKRAAFIARTNGAAFGVPPTEEQVAEASRLYEAFKAAGGRESFDLNLLNRTRKWMTSWMGMLSPTSLTLPRRRTVSVAVRLVKSPVYPLRRIRTSLFVCSTR